MITVNNVGDGTFKVSGKSFQPSTLVNIRVVDPDHPFDKNLFFTDTSGADGKITDVPTGSIGFGGERIAFSAMDGRVDEGVAVVSNTVTVTVPFPKPK